MQTRKFGSFYFNSLIPAMDIEEVKKSLSPSAGGAAAAARDALPARFYDAFVLNGLRLDIIEPGRVVCSMTVPLRLVNSKGYLHGGVIATLVDVVGSAPFYSAGIGTSGVSLEISTSFVDAAFAEMVRNHKIDEPVLVVICPALRRVQMH